MSNIIDIIEKEAMRTDLPKLSIGDTVKIAFRHGSVRETFTVRRLSFGVGVERTFPLHSPKIDHIDIVRHGRVRRAKLYYLRDRVGKAARLREVIKK